jgi:hypothetical protein
MRHLLVLGCAVLAMALAGLLVLELGRKAAADSSLVTAIFSPGSTPELMLARVAAADGRLIRGTVLPYAVEVAGDTPGIAARLEAAGAIVVARLPTSMLAVGGCSYFAPEAYPPRQQRLRPLPF